MIDVEQFYNNLLVLINTEAVNKTAFVYKNFWCFKTQSYIGFSEGLEAAQKCLCTAYVYFDGIKEKSDNDLDLFYSDALNDLITLRLNKIKGFDKRWFRLFPSKLSGYDKAIRLAIKLLRKQYKAVND